MNVGGKNVVARTFPSFRMVKSAPLMAVFMSSTGVLSMTIAVVSLDLIGTDTIAPTGISEAVKYERLSIALFLVRGMTVMMFMSYL